MDEDIGVEVVDADLMLSLMELFSLRAWGGKDGFLEQVKGAVSQLDNIRTVSDPIALYRAQGALQVLDFITQFEENYRRLLKQANHG
jgi:hypothetical protein